MCLIAIAFQVLPDAPLVVAANRDEFYRRPTEPSHWWEKKTILAGRDLEKGGTWMGVSKNGRFCALTNYRDPSETLKSKESRGHIVQSFLNSGQTAEMFLTKLETEKHRYPGFNIIAGTKNELFVYESRSGKKPFKLFPGIHSVSNAFFNTPWPKTNKAKEKMASCLTSKEKLFAMLGDKEEAPVDQLPATGVPFEWEKLLSPIFIESPEYGTRTSTVMVMKADQTVEWTERTFRSGIFVQERNFSFVSN